MTSQEKDALQYRFEGYQLPLIQLDETGPTYVVLSPHPYFSGQPLYWQKSAYTGNSFSTYGQIGGNVSLNAGNNFSTSGSGNTYDMLSF